MTATNKGDFFIEANSVYNVTDKEYENEILEVEAISGAFFVIRNDALNTIGLFDENVFLFYEEDILAKQIAEKNYKVISFHSGVNYYMYHEKSSLSEEEYSRVKDCCAILDC